MSIIVVRDLLESLGPLETRLVDGDGAEGGLGTEKTTKKESFGFEEA